MKYERIVARIIREFGESVTLARDGLVLGQGRAILRPVPGGEEQYLPTRLGEKREERLLCLAEAGMPFAPQPGETVVRRRSDAYDVVNVRAVTVGEEPVYWRAVLRWRAEEEAAE